MIDPFKITNFERTQYELEEFLLFAVVAAGKTASVQAKALEKFLSGRELGQTPFDYIKKMDGPLLLELLKEVRMGQYSRIMWAFRELSNSNLDLRTCSTEDLEKISGIGRKTSRFFILHSRPNQKYAVIDTHVMKWLREQGYTDRQGPPPSAAWYRKLELVYIQHLEKEGVADFAAYDLGIWTKYTKNKAVSA